MLNIDKHTIFKINPKNIDVAPKDIYILKDLEVVKKIFSSAFIIPFVRWHRLASFLEKEDSSFSIERLAGKTYLELQEREKDIEKKITNLGSKIKEMYTVIPFTPSKKQREDVTDWKLDENNLMEKSRRLFSSYMYVGAESKEFMRLLLENGNAMAILVRGVYYENPCAFCASMFNRISGECEIFNTDNYHRQTCLPRITFASDIINVDETIDLTDRSDYSKVLANDFWNKGATLEV